jgi:hypothetical protein
VYVARCISQPFLQCQGRLHVNQKTQQAGREKRNSRAHDRFAVWKGVHMCRCGRGIKLLVPADVVRRVWFSPLSKEALWSWIKRS